MDIPTVASETGGLFTAEMFAPIVSAVVAIVPIAVGVGVSIMAATWVAKKGFTIVKSMMNKG